MPHEDFRRWRRTMKFNQLFLLIFLSWKAKLYSCRTRNSSGSRIHSCRTRRISQWHIPFSTHDGQGQGNGWQVRDDDRKRRYAVRRSQGRHALHGRRGRRAPPRARWPMSTNRMASFTSSTSTVAEVTASGASAGVWEAVTADRGPVSPGTPVLGQPVLGSGPGGPLPRRYSMTAL
jgi:hypothetical protein